VEARRTSKWREEKRAGSREKALREDARRHRLESGRDRCPISEGVDVNAPPNLPAPAVKDRSLDGKTVPPPLISRGGFIWHDQFSRGSRSSSKQRVWELSKRGPFLDRVPYVREEEGVRMGRFLSIAKPFADRAKTSFRGTRFFEKGVFQRSRRRHEL